jgi:undecaprenyl-diphosphatase
MPLHHLLILALIQGITEFLPISSSGHLVLFHAGLSGGAPSGWAKDQMLDVAVHVGTLIAALVYFRRDICAMLATVLRMGGGDGDSNGAGDDDFGHRLLVALIIASLPVIIAGFALHMAEPAWLRSLEVVAWATLGFGIVLWICDRYAPAERDLGQLTWRGALIIGLAQILALIPGTSRSGITMSAGRALGLTRTETARFSLLLAIVAISGAGFLSGIDLWQSGNLKLGMDMALAALLAAISGWLAIHLMLAWLARASFTPFVIYRIVLGGGLVILLYGGYVPARL